MYGPEALRRDVVVCASASKLVDIGSPYGPIEAVGIDALDTIDDAKGLIHLAFLTRELIARLGVRRYVEANRRITSRVADFIDRNPGMPIITTSSGAARIFDQKPLDIDNDPYATLKQEEEEIWKRNKAERLALVFRVYAGTGRFIKGPEVFALSDFITRALAGERIRILSKRPVIRSYVHIGSLMRLCWSILERSEGHGFRIVDASMQTLSLEELAEMISVIWNLPKPQYNYDYSLSGDNYQADSEYFLELLKRHKIKIPSMAEQIKETADFLTASDSQRI